MTTAMNQEEKAPAVTLCDTNSCRSSSVISERERLKEGGACALTLLGSSPPPLLLLLLMALLMALLMPLGQAADTST